jgi:DNA (cytosine-5)-methyltransferase 1
LELLGYQVDSGVQRADEVGVAQRRRRFFLLASLDSTPSLSASIERRRRRERPVTWAIEDLGGEGEGAFESSAVHSAENRRRIAYLFEHDLHDLPDRERPACHRDKPHSYTAVYGRMRADEPAPTITVGFGSTGQGRFVHPCEPRTLTPHEAARVQSFPDWFDFGSLRRGQLQKAIGNAVPPMLASAVVGTLLPGGSAS